MPRTLATNRVLVRNFGTCLNFNGTSNSVSIPDSSDLELTSTFTISAWINMTTLTNQSFGSQRVVAKENIGNTASNSYGFGVSTSGKLRFTIFTVVDIDDTGSLTIPSKYWTHIAVTHTGTSYKFYVNGVLNSTITNANSPTTNAQTFFIGRRGKNATPGTDEEFFKGLIDEIAIWNGTALSDVQVSSLCSAGTLLATNLIGNWKMDEGSGTTLIDSTGKQANGTINGATYSSAVFSVPRTLATNRVLATGRTLAT